MIFGFPDWSDKFFDIKRQMNLQRASLQKEIDRDRQINKQRDRIRLQRALHHKIVQKREILKQKNHNKVENLRKRFQNKKNINKYKYFNNKSITKYKKKDKYKYNRW